MLRILVLLCALAGSPAWSGEPLLLWEAGHARGTVYLFGSVHVCKADCFPLSASVTQRLEGSDALVLELDPENVKIPPGLAKLPAGESLARKMSAQDWQSVSQALARFGMPAQVMSAFQPWAVFMSLSLGAARQAGFEVEHGIDLWALRRSRTLGKAVFELESLERQLAAISAGSEGEQLARLLGLSRQIESGHAARVLEVAREAWQRGDARALERLTLEDMPAGSGLHTELILRRNAEMADKIPMLLQDARRKLFVVVGAAHLVGEQGVPALLARQGFKVRQLHDGE